MFDVSRSAAEAKRMLKCERIYHRGQVMAWDGKDILPELIAKHGGIHMDPEALAALRKVFSIILWGELAAWRISAQLADRLVPLEAKMAATSQAHDEARHFYVMHDYLREIGYTPEPLDRAPQALLHLVLETDHLAYKLLGMQLLIETIALAIFQTVREIQVEPVLCELMTYYERDEARHVGLGMQYLPTLIQGMSRAEVHAMLLFQARLIFWALWENKLLEREFAILGIDPRMILDRARRKQIAALEQALNVLGLSVTRDRNPPTVVLNAVIELMFPTDATRGSRRRQLREAWRALRGRPMLFGPDEFDVHSAHPIKTARGVVVSGEPADA
jgi:hypothetical protein